MLLLLPISVQCVDSFSKPDWSVVIFPSWFNLLGWFLWLWDKTSCSWILIVNCQSRLTMVKLTNHVSRLIIDEDSWCPSSTVVWKGKVRKADYKKTCHSCAGALCPCCQRRLASFPQCQGCAGHKGQVAVAQSSGYCVSQLGKSYWLPGSKHWT